MIAHACEQNSPEWLSLRAGMPTASSFSKVVTSTGAESKGLGGYALTLAAETYAGGPVDAWGGNSYTERGHELEAEAIARYEFDRDVTVERVGFVTDDDATCGCSPDALVGERGLIEIKCLKAENHILAILYHQKHRSSPPDYVQQTQGQLLITGRAWCDLVFYHPSLPLLVVRQRPDDAVRAGLRGGIKKVIGERDRIVSALRGTREAA